MDDMGAVVPVVLMVLRTDWLEVAVVTLAVIAVAVVAGMVVTSAVVLLETPAMEILANGPVVEATVAEGLVLVRSTALVARVTVVVTRVISDAGILVVGGLVVVVLGLSAL